MSAAMGSKDVSGKAAPPAKPQSKFMKIMHSTGLVADFSHLNFKDPFNMNKIGTTWWREVRGGTVTFLTMAYILPVATGMLGTVIPHKGDITIAVAAGGCIGSTLMGLLANFPFGLAPGMTPNAYFTYTVVLTQGIPWNVALTAVFCSGMLFLVTSVLGLRALLMRLVPRGIVQSLGVAVGLFLCFIGFQDAGFVVAHPATLVTLNTPLVVDRNYDAAKMWLSASVIVVVAVMYALKVPGAPLWGICFGTMVAWSECWATQDDSMFQYPLASCGPAVNATEAAAAGCGCLVPPRVAEAASIDNTLGAFEWNMISNPEFWLIVLTFFYSDVLDSSGTFFAVCDKAGYVDKYGRLPEGRTNMAFLADAIASIVGSCLGTSTVTTYVESCAGVVDGGRTGLVAVVIGLWFALAIPFAPVISAIPAAATAPILVIVGALMMTNIMGFDWNDLEEAFPAFAVIAVVPFTFNIAYGIIAGVMLWLIIQTLMAPVRMIKGEDPLIKFKLIWDPTYEPPASKSMAEESSLSASILQDNACSAKDLAEAQEAAKEV